MVHMENHGMGSELVNFISERKQQQRGVLGEEVNKITVTSIQGFHCKHPRLGAKG